MPASLRPYPAYRDSGMKWLGKVPEHWEVRRLKTLLDNVVDSIAPRRGGVTLALEHVESWTGRIQSTRPAVAFDSQAKRFRAGDILFGKLRPYLAKVAKPTRSGACVSEFLVLRPAQSAVDARYVEHFLRSKKVIEVVDSSTFGAKMPRADWTFIGGLLACLPTPAEQSAIARFLDHASRRIRRYILVKQKLMDLLEEQKQAIIHQAVTGGIDVRNGQPYPAYKSSKVEWLGEIPKHWEIRALTRNCIQISDYRGATPKKTDSGVVLVTARNIRRGWIDYDASKEFVAEEEYDSIMRRGLPCVGDLLITTEAPLGFAALVDREDIALAQRVIRFRLNEKVLMSRFGLLSVLDSYFQNQLQCRGTGSTALGIKGSKLPQLKIICPPIGEQRAILVHLQMAVQDCERKSAVAARLIGLLEEYSVRLIVDVVTGKLDVREAAATLPRLRCARGREPGQDDHTESHAHATERGIAEEAIL